MALDYVMRVSELEKGMVLAPERYDPRKRRILSGGIGKDSILLADIVEIAKITISPDSDRAKDREYLVIDTSNAFEGIIIIGKQNVSRPQFGSAKKLLNKGDVIVSRLRPYLRQVAYVDSEIPGWIDNVALLCSTEFFVLRSKTPKPISFLVPFLLSTSIQAIFAMSQEGGHHPRFSESTLLTIPLPKKSFENSDRLSLEVEKRVALYRNSERLMGRLIDEVEEHQST